MTPGWRDSPSAGDSRREFRIGDWLVRPELSRIERDGREVRVKPKSMAVLCSLVAKPGEVQSRRELLDAVWGDVHVSEEVLTQAVAELRRAFGDRARDARVIETVPRRGYRLVAAVGGPVTRRPESAVDTPLVGREDELSRLQDALERTTDGRGRLVLLAGPPGIGKTRLAAEMLARARTSSLRGAAARCREDQAVAYLPFVEILEQLLLPLPVGALSSLLGEAGSELARLVPELRRALRDLPPPAVLPAEQERRYLFNAVLEVLERASRASPLCLVVDDLHWADRGTVRLLLHLAAALERLRVLLVGTYRDTELSPEHPFHAALVELTRAGSSRRIEVGSLSRTEVAAMLRALGGCEAPDGVVSYFLQMTEGNPFFVGELYRHLEKQGRLFEASGRWKTVAELEEPVVPEGVRLVLLHRLRSARPATLEFLTAAAVEGRIFTPAHVGSVLGLEPTELVACLDEAERGRWIRPLAETSGHRRFERYLFEHDLIRHTLLGEVSSARRRQLHLLLAGSIESLHGSQVDREAEDMIRHLVAAGDLADAAAVRHWSTRAGDRAVAAAAYERALEHFDRVLRLTPEETAARAHALFQRGYALRALGSWEEAAPVWEQTLRLYERLGEPGGAVRTIEEMLIVAAWALDVATVEKLAKRGLDLLGGSRPRARCSLLSWLGLARGVEGDHESARRCFAEARELAHSIGEAGEIGRALVYSCNLALAEMTTARKVEQLALAADLLDRSRYVWEHVLALGLLLIGRYCRGEWREVKALEAEVEPYAERVGHQGVLLWVGHHRALRYLAAEGAIEWFAEDSRRRLEIGSTVIQNPGPLPIDCALASFWLGRWDEAWAMLEKAQSEAVSLLRMLVSGTRLQVAAYHRPESAHGLLEEHEEVLQRRPGGVGDWWLLAGAVEALLVLGRRDEAASLYPAFRRGREETGAVVLQWSGTLFEKLLGLAAAAGSRWKTAERHFATALRQAKDLPNVIEEAEIRRWWAWALLERGDRGDGSRALKHLDAARRGYRRLGMPRHLALAEAVARREW